jgi:hypothetical protein
MPAGVPEISMTNVIRACFAACACLLLAACYVSDNPLYNATTDSFYPFAAGAHYQRYTSTPEGEWNLDESGTLNLNGSWYQTVNSKGDQSKLFIVKSWGQYAIIEGQDGNSYIYDLVRIDGDTVYDYGVSCDDDDPDALKNAGLISRIDTDENGLSSCKVETADALQQILQRALDAGAKPDSKYVFEN